LININVIGQSISRPVPALRKINIPMVAVPSPAGYRFICGAPDAHSSAGMGPGVPLTVGIRDFRSVVRSAYGKESMP
jgi:hypothetical protein